MSQYFVLIWIKHHHAIPYQKLFSCQKRQILLKGIAIEDFVEVGKKPAMSKTRRRNLTKLKNKKCCKIPCFYMIWSSLPVFLLCFWQFYGLLEQKHLALCINYGQNIYSFQYRHFKRYDHISNLVNFPKFPIW